MRSEICIVTCMRLRPTFTAPPVSAPLAGFHDCCRPVAVVERYLSTPSSEANSCPSDRAPLPKS